MSQHRSPKYPLKFSVTKNVILSLYCYRWKRSPQRLKVNCQIPDCLSPFPDDVVAIAQNHVRFLEELCLACLPLRQLAHRSTHPQSSMTAGDLTTGLWRLAAIIRVVACGRNSHLLADVGTCKRHRFARRDHVLS